MPRRLVRAVRLGGKNGKITLVRGGGKPAVISKTAVSSADRERVLAALRSNKRKMDDVNARDTLIETIIEVLMENTIAPPSETKEYGEFRIPKPRGIGQDKGEAVVQVGRAFR